MDLASLAIAALAITLGGIVKGATGAGAPVVAVPVLAVLYDVPTAVAVFTIPNLVSNIWQGWQFRAQRLPRSFTGPFALGGAAGAVAGSVMLAFLPAAILLATVAAVVLFYVAFRLARPDWRLSMETGTRWAGAAGGIGGVLQGAAGLSAPVSVTYLSAMKPVREVFIATISIFFLVMTVPQIVALMSLGLLTGERIAAGALACLPLFGAIPLGQWLASFLSPRTFDRILLVLLSVIALRLLWQAFA